jgi:hypothetical protein
MSINKISNEILKGKDTTELNQLMKKVPKEKGINQMPTIQIFKKNGYHQSDLLFLPSDRGYKYALVVVDASTKFTDAEPLKTKTAIAVKKALIKIYDRKILSPPKVMMCDDGGEFKGTFKSYLDSKNISIRYALPSRHRQQALVESKNKVIGGILNNIMAQEELTTGKTSRKWVANLPEVINKMNSKLKKPLTTEPSPLPYSDKSNVELLTIGTKVLVPLDHPIDVATGKKLFGKFRTGDVRWQRTPKSIDNIVLKPSQPPMYMVKGDSKVLRTRQQLQPV